MKKLLFIFVLALMLFLTGCNKKVVEFIQEPENTSMFCEVERGSNWKVVYHRDTKVMYVVSIMPSNQGIFTLLVDADGKPLLYEGGE